ncbi:anaphase-promoting complex, cyclosome, subunit 4-domain-containing protein [Phellopilus nigrolimitatus]|nr:anaphase-promoting complex, cyclosome, subunit 4-domain-containing protein [Phellopilus nigrolimitatus]
MEDATVISSLATVRLQAQSRLLPTACCPDKDLVILISRVGSDDKMSLWNMQGAKKWEVDMNQGGSAQDEITALNWSPDGKSIVVAHHPPRVSLHSLQNGREEHSLSVGPSPSPMLSPPRITGVWWFKKERKINRNEMPDMFLRGNVVTGSALSILRTQPLLDTLQDDTLPLNATDLFAFQGAQSRTKTSSLPEVIASWPALPSDPLAASIKPSPRAGDNRPGEELDERDLTNVDSLLVATDDAGQIHCYLDGSYPLGAIQLGPGCEAKTLMKNSEETVYPTPVFNNLTPMTVELPLLDAKSTRLIAENCSAARDLVWYTMRVVKEMRKSWFGGDGHDGARELNAKYVRDLEERQARFDQETNAVFDLTVLLATGKSSSALSDFNQTGDLTSERGLQKWESTVGEALLRLRDYSEKRVAPACQRLHLLLEEVRGWSLLPQLYGKYEFSTEDVDVCLDLTARAIIIAAWLAATARRELYRFTEFISFLRYETSRLSATNDNTIVPRHDILEVNEYLMSGLVVSSIDRWFIGPVPQFSPDSIATPQTVDLRSVIDHACAFASDPSKLTWPPITQKKDLSHLDRNLDALVHALAERCQQVFDRAARAVARTAALNQTWTIPEQTLQAAEILQNRVAELSLSQLRRMRAVREEKVHLAIRLHESEHGLSRCREVICMIRASHQHEGGSRTASIVAVAILECRSASEDEDAVPEDDEGDKFHIFDMDFFDEESLVIVYESYAKEGAGTIGMVNYCGIEYTEVDLRGNVRGLWQEDIVAEAIKQVKTGQVACAPAPIRRQRGLKVCGRAGREQNEGPGAGTRTGTATLAVNGRVGRRVGCVLDGEGNELEMFDMEGDEEEEEGLATID